MGPHIDSCGKAEPLAPGDTPKKNPSLLGHTCRSGRKTRVIRSARRREQAAHLRVNRLRRCYTRSDTLSTLGV